jgi:uncharacterized HAD superfamily protein
MSQLQTGVCVGFVLTLIGWCVFTEYKLYLEEKKNVALKGELSDEKIKQQIKSLDQPSIDKLLSEDLGTGDKPKA